MTVPTAEVDLTRDGLRMIDNFLKGVCGLAGSFRMEDRMQRCMDYIRRTAGDSKVRKQAVFLTGIFKSYMPCIDFTCFSTPALL